MVTVEAIQKMIEDMKCKSSIEEQQADALESAANEKRQYSKALDICVKDLESLLG